MDLIESRKMEKRREWTDGMRKRGDVFFRVGNKSIKYGSLLFGASLGVGSTAQALENIVESRCLFSSVFRQKIGNITFKIGSQAFGIGIFGLNGLMLPGIVAVFYGMNLRISMRRTAEIVESGYLDRFILEDEDYSIQHMGKQELKISLLVAHS